MTVFERIVEEMGKQNVKVSQLCNGSGISNVLFYQWKKGLQQPSAKSLIKVAEYLNVSYDYLLTGNKPQIDEQLATSASASEQRKALLEYFVSLSDDELEKAKSIMEVIKGEQK